MLDVKSLTTRELRDAVNEYNRRWHKAHPEKAREYKANSKKRKIEAFFRKETENDRGSKGGKG